MKNDSRRIISMIEAVINQDNYCLIKVRGSAPFCFCNSVRKDLFDIGFVTGVTSAFYPQSTCDFIKDLLEN